MKNRNGKRGRERTKERGRKGAKVFGYVWKSGRAIKGKEGKREQERTSLICYIITIIWHLVYCVVFQLVR